MSFISFGNARYLRRKRARPAAHSGRVAAEALSGQISGAGSRRCTFPISHLVAWATFHTIARRGPRADRPG